MNFKLLLLDQVLSLTCDNNKINNLKENFSILILFKRKNTVQVMVRCTTSWNTAYRNLSISRSNCFNNSRRRCWRLYAERWSWRERKMRGVKCRVVNIEGGGVRRRGCEGRLRCLRFSGLAFSLLAGDGCPLWLSSIFPIVLQFKFLLLDGFKLVPEVELRSFFL